MTPPRDAMWETITGCENLLVLATRPSDETADCGGLIARSCRRGRPPFVVVLTDGSTSDPANPPDRQAALQERRSRTAVRHLGLPAHRLLMAGLFDVTVPAGGPAFEAVVQGVTMIMWGRDCNVICAPALNDGTADQIAAHHIAIAVAARSGVGLLLYQSLAADAARLDITAELPAKRAALAAYGLITDPPACELFTTQRP